MVCSFVLGGGLSTLLTIRTVRHNHLRDAELGDFNALRSIIEGQGAEIAELQKRLNSQADVWRTSCIQCSYREFYLEQERRLNEKITARAEKKGEADYGGHIKGDALDDAIGRMQPGAPFYPLG